MYLKKLEVVGFKSFAAKTVLELSPEIIGVVGPNGSGKSNIAEAIRWALGEQSYKLLRSKKSEDVVFAGSDGRSKASYAEVKLLLDNGDTKMPVDLEEIEITRRLYRSGEGEYYLNGRKVRLLDLVELLSQAGFGQSTYTVVGQGMIDNFLISSPADRKILFDEAAGIKQYDLRREQAVKKLSQTESNLVRIQDILSELTPRLEILRKQAEKAESREDVEKELKLKSEIYFSATFHRINSQIKSVKEGCGKLNAQIAEVDDQIRLINHKLDNFEEEQKNYQSLDRDHREKLAEFEEERTRLLTEQALLQARLEYLKESGDTSDLEKKIKLLKGLGEKISYERQRITVYKEELKGREGLLKHKLSETKAVNDKLGELQVSGQIQPADLHIVWQITDSITELLKSPRPSMATIKKSISLLHEKLSSLRGRTVSPAKIRDLKKLIDKLTQERETLSEKIKDLSVKIATANHVIDTYSEQVQELTKEVKAASREKSENPSELQKDLETVGKTLKIIEAKASEQLSKIRESEQRRSKDLNQSFSLRSDFSNLQNKRTDYVQKLSSDQTELTALNSELASLRDQYAEYGIKEKLEDLPDHHAQNLHQLEDEVRKLRGRLSALGEVDEEVIKEFKETNTRHQFMADQVGDLESARGDLRKVIDQLDEMIEAKFTASFEKINEKFSEYFNRLFSGGKAGLKLNKDESSYGVDITVSPPGKRLQSLHSLSGGEKAMTSVALLCAILSVNPSPFCVLDEVDAALDEANTTRFGDILVELSEKTQFVIITHNRATMRRAASLYGITMDENHVSKMLSMKFEEAKKYSKV